MISAAKVLGIIDIILVVVTLAWAIERTVSHGADEFAIIAYIQTVLWAVFTVCLFCGLHFMKWRLLVAFVVWQVI